ncbi:ESX secretion-associated protein EspG [Actinopolyspora sp. H202]|uniref:ESX secretion-associated protein EspG n=1 Tax=Actinopolyspora sp. H202 TaxID=1500456 RepID=UPI003EE51AC0
MLDLDSLEFAVLAEGAGIARVPTVAAYRNYGTLVDDVDAEFDAAERRCRQRGLLDRSGRPEDGVAELLALYERASVEYDLRFSAQRETELRAAVCGAGRAALRTVVSGDRVRLDRISVDQPIPAILAVLPEHEPLRMRPLSVELSALRSVYAEADEGSEPDQREVEPRLRALGVDTREFRRITELLAEPRLGVGELGVTVWEKGGAESRGEQTVKLIDIGRGRMAVYNGAGRRMLCGADPATIGRVLGEVAELARRRLRE